jgi:hypothetical protein
MGCIEAMKYEIIKRHVSFREAAEYVRKHLPEAYEVPPGYPMFDIHIIGVPPILIGVEGTTLVFPYTKPCHGTFLLRLESAEEAEHLRKAGKRV